MNFTIDQRNNGYKAVVQKCIKHIMNENLLLLKDLLGTLRIRFLSIWPQCQKNVYINKLDDIVNEYNNTYQSTIKKN